MFADVIVPVSVPNIYTYGVPIEYQDELKIGQRVEVEFGKRKRYAAVVCNIHQNKPDVYEPKPIITLLDDQPLITKEQIRFWQWMSNYYMSNIGDVLNAALPSALRLSSESTVKLIMENDVDVNELTDDEYLLFEALSNNNELTIDEIRLILDKKNIYPVLSSMIEQRIVAMKESLKKKYKPKTKKFVRLNPIYSSEEKKKELLDELDRAPKQSSIALTYFSLFPQTNNWIEKKKLLKQSKASTSVFSSLLEKSVFEEEEREVERLTDDGTGNLNAALSTDQQRAVKEINNAFQQNKTTLLHGVTGSGKTHIYIHLIEEQIKKGNQSLYLLPEIALTSQIIKRLKDHFGGDVGIYHSKFSDAERVEIWNKSLNNTYKVIVGTRSAVFLPFQKLGLLIVDEEHDSSYKQYDPSPRYNARDAAIWLATLFNANCLLGSATPSFESYFNATNTKYALVNLKERYGDIQLPEIEIVNMLKQYIPGKTYRKFSKRLIDELKDILVQNKQAILFRNRRGYSSFVQCSKCAHNIQCDHCDVTLTYHKYRDQLECHYCGFKQKVPYRCPACGNTEMEKIGLGTEQVQEELNVFLPSAKIGRMDLDTTRNKYGHERIIQQFEEKKIDILVGTQMVTKGLHFDDVQLVGILNADAILKFPDFRAQERAFQVMEQVSGRAGRRGKQGKVIVQVRDEKDLVLNFLQQHNYEAFYKATIDERWKWKYPPFYRLIAVTLKHKDWKTCYQAAVLLGSELRKTTSAIIKGPSEPLISKVRNYYLQELFVTIEKDGQKMNAVKNILQQKTDFVKQQKGNSQLRINIDVDPM